MKTLDTSPMSSTNLMLFKGGHFNFLQLSHKETVGAALHEIIGDNYDSSIPYVLYGLESASAGPTTDFGAGAIFFNGEVFLFNLQTFHNPSGSDVFLVNIDASTFTTDADPTDFSGGTPSNVCLNRRAVIATGTTGTGQISDYSNLVYLQYAWTDALSLTASVGSPNTIAITSTLYNKYKFANGLFTWTFKVKCTITGTTTLACNFEMSGNPINAEFANPGGFYACTYVATGSSLPQPAHAVLVNDSGLLQVSIILPSTTSGIFTAGSDIYFDVTIVTEMVSLGL